MRTEIRSAMSLYHIPLDWIKQWQCGKRQAGNAMQMPPKKCAPRGCAMLAPPLHSLFQAFGL
jgi:hypothetical protein